MNHLSIKARLWLLVAGLLTVLAITSGLLFQRLYVANQAIASVYDNQVVPLKQMSDVLSGYSDGVIGALDRADRQLMSPGEAVQAMAAGRSQINTNWNAFLQTDLFPNEQVAVEKLRPLHQRADPIIGQIIEKMRSGQVSAALEQKKAELDPLTMPILQGLESISAMQLLNGKKTTEKSVQEMQTMLWIVGIGSLIVFGTCISAAHLLIRKITSSVDYAVKVAEHVAQGDLSTQIEVTGQDETARLLKALGIMTNNLRDIVRQIRDSSESIVTGSTQIASGNNDLSQRTEEQASNLQRTAASMEELTATTRQNSDNANQATRLAGEASQTAATGGDAMERVNQTMANISNSSNKISDIIGVIDSIAFQTNILALNAAVEAARAGEQGRGFAVVAGEVRTLAQRSAEAAKEIKALIGQSVSEVAEGTKLVSDTSQTIGAIVNQVRNVASLISEISVASSEQSEGITQISDAVAQLDQVTQQNAALVEESAAAAASLSQQASDLNRAVASFKLHNGEALHTAAHAVASRPARSATASAIPKPTRLPDTTPVKPAAVRATPRPAVKPMITSPSKPISPAPTSAPKGSDDDWETF